jgi:protein-tyrosine phosphatase
VTGFVDLHTHVIPSGDDGAPDVDAGLELCRAMAAAGTSVVYGTPHAHPPDSWFPLTEERIALVRRSYAEMKPRCAEFGLELRLGWELSATGVLVGRLGDYVLEGTDAILLELPGPWFSFEDEVAVTREQATAIRSAGFRVVLAHPERSLGAQRRPELLLELVEEGALVCFNADSFVGGHGAACESCAWRLLELGVGDFVASDAHRPERPSRLHEAVDAIAARHGMERALALAQGGALLGTTSGARG